MESTRTAESSPLRAPARALPRLSRRTGFWAIAFSFLAVAASRPPQAAFTVCTSNKSICRRSPSRSSTRSTRWGSS